MTGSRTASVAVVLALSLLPAGDCRRAEVTRVEASSKRDVAGRAFLWHGRSVRVDRRPHLLHGRSQPCSQQDRDGSRQGPAECGRTG